MKTLVAGGIRQAFDDRGTGPPAVLVHGFPLDHTMWNAQIEALAPKYRVIAPDLRGFGRSEVVPGTTTMEQFADDLAVLLDALAITAPIVLAGLSMGGYVAWQFWRKYAARLRGLVLCDTRAAADTPQQAAARREMAERVLAEGPGPLVESMLPRLFAPETTRQRAEVVESLRRVMMAADPHGIAAAAYGMAVRPDVGAMLPQIACPTLAIVGELDVISPPEEMQAIAAAIPGARLLQIPGAGHMSPIERPEEVSAALREFLAGL